MRNTARPSPPLLLIAAAGLYICHLIYIIYRCANGYADINIFRILGGYGMFIYALLHVHSVRHKLWLVLAVVTLETLSGYITARLGLQMAPGSGYFGKLASTAGLGDFSRIVATMSGLGYCAGILAAMVAVWQAWKSKWRDGEANQQVLVLLLIQVFLAFTSPFIRSVAMLPYTVDPQLYTFELSTGVNFPAFIGQLFIQSPLFMGICRIAYVILPATLLVAYRIERTRTPHPPVNIMEAFLWGGVMAALYFVTPACGPLQTFGALFPHTMPLTMPDNIRCVDTDLIRNAMPSLHMTWAFLLWFSGFYFYPRGYKILFVANGLLTLCATMGTGEHYFIDLVVALPLSVGVYAFSFRGLPWQAPERKRAVLCGFIMTAIWLIVLWHLPDRFTFAGAWAAIIFTIAASLWLLHSLVRAFKRRAI